ncbi:MAG TPA: caspase family protein, partial [Verrucomicrobium sp.]|nr:caspase family protein [Verrucomicrobium sp.]
MKILWIHAGSQKRFNRAGWKQWHTELESELQAAGLETRTSVSEHFASGWEEPESWGNESEALQAVAELAQGLPVSGVATLLRDPNTITVESALMGRAAQMITTWTKDSALRKQLRCQLREELATWSLPDGEGTELKILLAHGLGSLIAYDTLLSNPDLGKDLLLLTFGSHLGHPAARNVYGGRLQPLEVKHWYNLHNPHDRMFTSALSLVDPRFTEVRTPFAYSDGDLNHAPIITGREKDAYLDHPVVRELVWPAILNAGTSAKAKKVSKSATAAQGVFQPSHRALLIGIDTYQHSGIPELKGCINDTYLVSSVLQECGMPPEQIRVLHNERATASEIRKRLHWLLEGASAGDTRLLYFSGHGTQLDSYSTGEVVDRQDECLVAWDYAFSRDTGILDDDIWRLYAQLPYDVNFFAIMDCCHAGGTHRGQQRVRG